MSQLHAAAQKGDLQECARLVREGADVDTRNEVHGEVACVVCVYVYVRVCEVRWGKILRLRSQQFLTLMHISR